jgi:hypothetical protein
MGCCASSGKIKLWHQCRLFRRKQTHAPTGSHTPTFIAKEKQRSPKEALPSPPTLVLEDFMSKGEYDMFMRFHKYPLNVILKSDFLYYQVELARENLLRKQLRVQKTKDKIKQLMDLLNPTLNDNDADDDNNGKDGNTSFGIGIVITMDHVTEKIDELKYLQFMHVQNVIHCQKTLDRCYYDLMQFWDKAFDELLASETESITAESY